MKFILTLRDRNGKELKEGDVVRVSNGREFSFYSEVKYLPEMKKIAPFHTFSFHSFEKVDGFPKSCEFGENEGYKIAWIKNPKADLKAEDYQKYLIDWRECEMHIENSVYTIEPSKP